MQHKIYTIYDTKSEAYLQPFFLKTHGLAVRTFTDCVNDPKHQFGRHPADYNLFFLGDFEDTTSEWTIEKTPQNLGKGTEFLETPILPMKASA